MRFRYTVVQDFDRTRTRTGTARLGRLHALLRHFRDSAEYHRARAADLNGFFRSLISKTLGNVDPQRTLGTFLAWPVGCGPARTFNCGFTVIECRAVSR